MQGGAQALSFSALVENVAQPLRATAIGLNNMLVVLGIWAGQNIMGLILTQFDQEGANSIIYPSKLGYQVALTTSCALFFIIALIIGVLFIKDTHCKEAADELT